MVVRTLFLAASIVVMVASSGFAQWGDWSKPYEINNPYGSNTTPRTSREDYGSSRSSRSLGTLNGSRYDSDSLSNPFGAAALLFVTSQVRGGR